MLLELLGASLLGDTLRGKEVNRAGEGSNYFRAGYGFFLRLFIILSFFFDYFSSTIYFFDYITFFLWIIFSLTIHHSNAFF